MGHYGGVILSVVIFIAVVLTVQGMSQIIWSVGDQNRRVNRRLTMLASGMQHAEVYAALVRKPTLPFSNDPALIQLYDRIALYCRQAGLEISPLRLLGIVAGVALALWVVTL